MTLRSEDLVAGARAIGEQQHDAARDRDRAGPDGDADVLLLVHVELDRPELRLVALLGVREPVIDEGEHPRHDQHEPDRLLHAENLGNFRGCYHAGAASRAISAGGKLPPLAGSEIAEVEGAHGDAHELLDVVAHVRAHPAHLAVLAFGEDDLQPARAALGGAQRAHLRRTRHRAVAERDALAQRIEGLRPRARRARARGSAWARVTPDRSDAGPAGGRS